MEPAYKSIATTSTYRSNGKLLLSAEYVVLDGALAIGLPTKKGQTLSISKTKINPFRLQWIAFLSDGTNWFSCEIDTQNWSLIESTDSDKGETIKNILYQAHLLNPSFDWSLNYHCTTRLEFPHLWGLGSSSTLINNISQWLLCNPYSLLKKTFGGSGYDLACAEHSTAISYQLTSTLAPIVKKLSFDPKFKNQLYFVYLNQKQNSQSAMKHYKECTLSEQDISFFSKLSQRLISAKTLTEFEKILNLHEEKLSQLLGLEPIKKVHFSDYRGTIKSLGAWGGDFVLFTYREGMRDYLKKKGYTTIIPYKEMILS